MKKHKKYVGCFAADEMGEIPVKGCFGFVINTEPRHISKGHWTAVFIDKDKDKAIEYFDPFADEPPKQFGKGVKSLVKKLDTDEYLKYKVNRIKVQDITSDTCGYHCMNFLLHRFSGKPFREVTGFDDSIKGEKDAEKLKKKYSTFGYV